MGTWELYNHYINNSNLRSCRRHGLHRQHTMKVKRKMMGLSLDKVIISQFSLMMVRRHTEEELIVIRHVSLTMQLIMVLLMMMIGKPRLPILSQIIKAARNGGLCDVTTLY